MKSTSCKAAGTYALLSLRNTQASNNKEEYSFAVLYSNLHTYSYFCVAPFSNYTL